MRFAIAALAILLFAEVNSAEAARYRSPSSMMRMMQQRQQQLQAIQQAALEQQMQLLKAQQAAEQHHREMHKQASDARREKEQALRERAIARRKAGLEHPKPRENPMASLTKESAKSVDLPQRGKSGNASDKP